MFTLFKKLFFAFAILYMAKAKDIRVYSVYGDDYVLMPMLGAKITFDVCRRIASGRCRIKCVEWKSGYGYHYAVLTFEKIYHRCRLYRSW